MDTDTISLLTEQAILLATIVGSVATLPALVEFIIERRKRKDSINLSLDDVKVDGIRVNLAGVDQILTDIKDLIDRVKYPAAYSSLKVGNEILIIGPPLSGKKTLAQKIAKEAGLHRIITIYNARNGDALTEARSLIASYSNQKLMVILPRIDLALEKEDDELTSKIDALIETCSELDNVWLVGTAVQFEADSFIDNLFGIILSLPGTQVAASKSQRPSEDMMKMLEQVGNFYLDSSLKAGFELHGLTREAFVQEILRFAQNPAEIEDIVVLCQTTATYNKRSKLSERLDINLEILRKSIRRVNIGAKFNLNM